MIKSVLIVNTHGKPRLVKFYEYYPVDRQQQIIQQVYQLVSQRSERACNFLESKELFQDEEEDCKIIYRHYATLYFIIVVDSSESELGVLDLIHVFVEALDKAFEQVCELDLIFNPDRTYFILDELIQGGMVLETSRKEIEFELRKHKIVKLLHVGLEVILQALQEQSKIEKEADPLKHGVKNLWQKMRA